ncbi:MAG TPA: hypothetical protein VLT87_12745 [Thermoanaerobaculia bacterium]|nr:hypothetical protein [Thermoanaerobaculia bacterium]
MSQIVIEVGKQGIGATFQLSSRTERMLGSRMGGCPRVSSVFISFDTRNWDFDQIPGPMWAQIVMLLTGLDEQRIRDLGGFKFVNPVDKEIFFESLAA